jgi:hypothetical protein
MAAGTTAIAMLQPVWDCKWSRPGHRLTGIVDGLQPETTWVCVHGGVRRNIGENDCQTCARWELGSGTITAAAEVGLRIARPSPTADDLGRLALRVVLLLTAAIFIATGAVLLTEPLVVPFTVTLWLCAAAMAGLAVFARFPADPN